MIAGIGTVRSVCARNDHVVSSNQNRTPTAGERALSYHTSQLQAAVPGMSLLVSPKSLTAREKYLIWISEETKSSHRDRDRECITDHCIGAIREFVPFKGLILG
jgi:hypothetical protein